MSSSARVAPASAVAAAVVAVVAEAAVVVVQGLALSQIAAQGASYGRTAKQGNDIMKESSFGEHQPRLFTAPTHTRARTHTHAFRTRAPALFQLLHQPGVGARALTPRLGR